jgi:hypothetical protein
MRRHGFTRASSTSCAPVASAAIEAGSFSADRRAGQQPHHTQLVNAVQGRSIGEIFRSPDDLKVRSSMTLFACQTEALGAIHGWVLRLCDDGQPAGPLAGGLSVFIGHFAGRDRSLVTLRTLHDPGAAAGQVIGCRRAVELQVRQVDEI